MRSVIETAEGTLEVKRSRFLAYLVPNDRFEEFLELLRREHPKAGHIPFARRALDAYGRCDERSSDDGEPKGCAGMPILNAMRGAELVECAILVVRYFGGIKLGTGGMARAYGAAASQVISRAAVFPYSPRRKLRFSCDYSAARRVRYLLENTTSSNGRCDYRGTRIFWEFELAEEELESVRDKLAPWVRFDS